MSKEIIEGNKLIAEFMKFVRGEDSYYGGMKDATGKSTFQCWVRPDGHKITHLYYDTSWDWLMPVVEKIGSLSYNDSNNKFQPSVERFLENDIESIWRQIVIFITWYNQ